MFPGYGGYGRSYESIPLDVRVPQMPSTTQYIGEMMNLQDAMQMRKLREAEIQNQNAIAQEREQTLRNQRIAREAMINSSAAPAAGTSMQSAMPPILTNTDDPGAPGGISVDQPATHAVSVAGNTLGNIGGHPIVNWESARRDFLARGGSPDYWNKIDTERRANEKADLDNYKTQLENQGKMTEQVSNIIGPLAIAAQDKHNDPEALQNLWRISRNELLQLPGPNGQPAFSEQDLPKSYTDVSPRFGSSPSEFIPKYYGASKGVQQQLKEHSDYLDATARAHQGQVKEASDKRDLANKWTASSQNPEDLDHAKLLAKVSGFTDDEINQYFPSALTPQTKAAAQRALVPAQDIAKYDESQRGYVASQLAAAYKQGGQAGYAAKRTELGDAATLWPENPKSTNDILYPGMTPAEIATAQYRDNTTDYRNKRLSQIDQEIKQRDQQFRKTQQSTFLNREADTMNKMQGEEQNLWQQHRDLEDVIRSIQSKNPPSQVYDPTSKSNQPLNVDDALKQRLWGEYNDLARKALGLQEQQRQMRARYSWGEYSKTGLPANPAPAAPSGSQGTGQPQKGTQRTLTQADVDRLARAGHTGYKAGQVITFDGSNWN